MIYLDNASTTKIDKEVLKAMLPYLKENFGNPSGLYETSRKSLYAVSRARAKIAAILRCAPSEIIFCGSGTESDNLAVFGTIKAFSEINPKIKPHIITSSIEHKAVLEPCRRLEKDGLAEVSYLKVSREGLVSPADVKSALKKNTVLVSVMHANNEIGTIQPIVEISKIVRDFKNSKQILNSKKIRNKNFSDFGFRISDLTAVYPLFHADACQAAGYLDIDVQKLGVDLLTLNGSKIYGPKGIGLLYKREGTPLSPMIFGGGQENGYRSGTENTALIVGLAEALESARKNRIKESRRQKILRDYFIAGVIKRVPKVILNGSAESRLPNNVNVTILDVEGESMVLKLDALGISASTGSACNSKSLEPSYVLSALGLPREVSHGSLRFTLGKETVKKDIDYVLKVLPKIVAELRAMSPVRIKLKIKNEKGKTIPISSRILDKVGTI